MTVVGFAYIGENAEYPSPPDDARLFAWRLAREIGEPGLAEKIEAAVRKLREEPVGLGDAKTLTLIYRSLRGIA